MAAMLDANGWRLSPQRDLLEVSDDEDEDGVPAEAGPQGGEVRAARHPAPQHEAAARVSEGVGRLPLVEEVSESGDDRPSRSVDALA